MFRGIGKTALFETIVIFCMPFYSSYRKMRSYQFPGFVFLGGHFPKWFFAEGRFNQKPLVFRKDPRTHLEVQGSFGDEGTFQECQKSWILKIPQFGETENWRRGVYFDAEYLSAQFCRVKTP